MSDLTGQTLGKYQLVDRLGRGGMADVYKGYQPGLDRYVAIKVMHPHLSEDANFITRFRREAKSVAELRHPYIVQVFDFDTQDDNYYMVMEYIEGGRTLKQVLQELAERGERLPLEQTLDITTKLADALAYAHNLGMIHRDLKPANVLLASLDRPVLSDFGIARLMNESGLTISGMLIGTPAYMSPEQGRGERIDARSDIYALGIVLYEMLTGQPPYDADTPYAIILKHINDPLTPPHLLTSPMPEAVERIVLKCLAKEAVDRFASMVELREALQGAQSAIGMQKTAGTIDAKRAAPTLGPNEPPPPTAPTPATISPAAAPVTRSGGVKPAYLIGGAVVVSVLFIAALVLITRPRADSGLATQLPTPTAAADNAPATLVDTPRPTQVSPVAQLLEAGYRALLIEDDNNEAFAFFDQAVTAAPADPSARVGRAIAQLKRYGKVDEALVDLEQAEQAIPDDPLVHFAYGLLYTRAEHLDEDDAEEEFTQVIDDCGDQAALCANAYYHRAQLRAWSLDNLEGGLVDMDHAIELHPDREKLDAWYTRRASLRFDLGGDLDGAIADLQAAYEIAEWPEHLQQAAVYAVEVEDYERALQLYAQLIEKTAGNPRYLAQRAYVELLADDVEAAQQSVERALSLEPSLLAAHYVKGLLLLEDGKPLEALKEFEPITQAQAVELYEMAEPFLNPRAGHEVHYDMARAALAADDVTAAQEYLTASLQKEKSWPEPYLLQAEILEEQGDLAGARESYLKAKDYAYDDPDLEAEIEQALADLAK
jgi:predicted Zn-dependent protease/tRNA A-37 threonylcarbamoyl transferase component Bud32